MTILFGKDSKGNIRIWEAREEVDGITLSSGLRDGKKTHKFIPITEGKANRSLQEQIRLEIDSRTKKKVDAGFKRTVEGAQNEDRTNDLGFVRPMLAKAKVTKYDTKDSFVQIKYDGLRCLITCKNGVNYAYSKSGIAYPNITHITDQIHIPEGTTIDGELYHHGTPLQTINSWVKRGQANTAKIKYQCYDLVSGLDFKHRLDCLELLDFSSSVCDLVPTWSIEGMDVNNKLAEVREEGYEGLIIRQPGYGYQDGKRNLAMLKLKVFLTGEFRIIGLEKSNEGWAVFHCLTADSKQFKVLAPGTHEEKAAYLLEDNINKWLEIQYPNLSKDGIPVQATALHIRDWD